MSCTIAYRGEAQDTPAPRPVEVERGAAENRPSTEQDRRQIHAWFLEGRYPEAIPLTQRNLRAHIDARGESHWQTMDAQAMDRMAHRGAAATAEQQQRFTKALQTLDQLWPGTAPPTDAQDVAFEESLAAFREVMGDDDLLVDSTRFKWAYSLFARGHLERATALGDSVVQATEQPPRRMHPLAATSRQLLARLLQLQHDDDRAEKLFRESAALFEQLLGPHHPQTLLTHAEHAQQLALLGQSREASVILKSLSDSDPLTHDRIDPTTIQTLTAMGYAHCELGEWNLGETLLQEAFRRARRLRSGRLTTGSIASAQLTLGLCWHGQGRLEEAAQTIRESVRLLESLHGHNHPLTQLGSAHLALVLYDLQQFDEAADILEAMFSNKRDASSPACLPSIARWIWLECRRYRKQFTPLEEFERQVQDEVRVAQERTGANSRRTLASQLLLARYWRSTKRDAEAASLYRQCLDAIKNHGTSVTYERLQLEQDAGEFYFLQGDDAQAEALLARASVTAEELRRLRGNQGLSSLWQFDRNRHWPLLSVLFARHGRAEEAWQAMEQSRARGLRDRMFLQENTISPGEEPQAAPLGSSPTSSDETLFFELERVQRSLASDAALVSWVGLWWQDRNQGEFWVGVLRSQGPPRWVRLPGDATNGSLSQEQLRLGENILASLTQAPRDVSLDWDAASANRLWQQRFAPITSLLTEGDGLPRVQQLVVLYPSATHVPVEVLTENYTVSYASSGTIYATLRERAVMANGQVSQNAPIRRMLAVGDPQSAPMDPVSSPASAARANDEIDQAELPGTRVELELIKKQFGDANTQIVRGADANVLHLDGMAARGELQTFRYLHFAAHGRAHDRAPLESAILLSPPTAALSSNSTDERSSSITVECKSGHLTARHVVTQWRLDADLVTLSACESGLGPMVRGEHFVGFSQAFLLAGSRSVVVSLWPVRDDATSLLMGRFYENLVRSDPNHGILMSKAESLAEAKKWLRELTMTDLERLSTTLSPEVRGRLRRRAPDSTPVAVHPFSHPYYWAPFVLVGDPGSR